MRPDVFHQNQLAPEDNKFHKGNGDDGKHYWLTPWQAPEFAALKAEFGPFDFDPCPFPKPDDFDGLTCDWGQRNYVNPPFGSIVHEGKKKGPTAWVRKAITEWQKGKLVVLVYPVDKWILMILRAILGDHAEVRNLGDVKWLATEDGSTGKGTGRHIACFILKPTPPANPILTHAWDEHIRARLVELGWTAPRTHGVKPCPHCDAPPGVAHSSSCPAGVNPVEAPSKPITSLAEFCAEGERLGLTAADLVEPLSKRPEFADCLPGADGVGGNGHHTNCHEPLMKDDPT